MFLIFFSLFQNSFYSYSSVKEDWRHLGEGIWILNVKSAPTISQISDFKAFLRKGVK